MALSKKHYIEIASTIKNLRVDFDEIGRPEEVLDSLAYSVAVYFKEDNPNFDTNKFLDACEVKR